ncbi:FAS-associated death domain protein isoform X1 [Lagenorhynchus albirostris]|uniref:FAS-associated death domain protein isoform X1 n=1 Tax=Lagenorhynchus albirostris TaxID=27610 RepID=UPI0028E614C7|nr:FAS-associated death domain protein isoform X1 [Lagenorhynchus albirostris]
MDPFLVLLHSVSASLSSSELTELKFLCQSRVGKRKLELVQSGLDLFNVLLEQTEMSRENTVLLRKLLVSLRRQDLLRRLDDFEAGAAGGAAPEERDLRAAFDIICDNVGKDWRKLARHLGVSDAKIEAIEEKYPRNLAEQIAGGNACHARERITDFWDSDVGVVGAGVPRAPPWGSRSRAPQHRLLWTLPRKPLSFPPRSGAPPFSGQPRLCPFCPAPSAARNSHAADS